MRKLYCYMAILLIVSCKREIDVKIENRQAVLVVNSELDKDSLMNFNLSFSQNITDNRARPIITDAVINIYDKDTLLLDALIHSGNGNYRSATLKPKINTQYYFRISKGSDAYWINEFMPDSFSVVVVDTSRIIFQGKKNFFQFNLQIFDKASEENFYGIRIRRFYDVYNGTDTVKAEEWIKMESIEFILTENPKTQFSNKHIVFKDEFFNGSVNQKLKFGCSDIFSIPGQKTRSLALYVSSYSLNGYNYYTSLNEHLFYQNDPFAQPTLLQGNISNAFGAVVGNYTRTFRFDVK